MMKKCDARYDSKSTTTLVSKMLEPRSITYTGIRDDISKHIDRLDGLLKQLQEIGAKLDETLEIGILVASSKVTKRTPVTEAIRKLAESDLKWETVSTRLIAEAISLRSGPVRDKAAALTGNVCVLCFRSGNTID